MHVLLARKKAQNIISHCDKKKIKSATSSFFFPYRILQIMLLLGFSVIVATIIIVIGLRLWLIIPGHHSSKPLHQRDSSCKTLIFLGSGRFEKKISQIKRKEDAFFSKKKLYKVLTRIHIIYIYIRLSLFSCII